LRILITGTPGVGKSTLAKALANKLKIEVLELSTVAFEEELIISYDALRESNIVDIEGLRETLRKRICAKEDILVVGHLIEAVPRECIDLVIVLRLHPLELMRRLRNRGYPEVKVRENVEAEVLDYVLIKALERFSKEKVIEVDVTDRDVSSGVSLLLKALSNPESFKPGKVDWIRALESEGSLDNIFRT